MLGRNSYTSAEITGARAAVSDLLTSYKALASATDADRSEFESRWVNSLVLALDRPFVHRIRPVSGKDGNPLNEVELIVDSLLIHGGVFRAGSVIKYRADDAVLGLRDGDPVRLTLRDFERLADAFFVELEIRFLEPVV